MLLRRAPSRTAERAASATAGALGAGQALVRTVHARDAKRCTSCDGTRLRRRESRRPGGRPQRSSQHLGTSPSTRRCRFFKEISSSNGCGARDRRRGAEGESAAACEFLGDGGPRLPLPRPRGPTPSREAKHNASGWPSQVGSGAHRRDLHPRRALHRTPPARQPAAAGETLRADARHRQHGGGGRARRGDHPRTRTTSIDFGPGAGVLRRTHRARQGTRQGASKSPPSVRSPGAILSGRLGDRRSPKNGATPPRRAGIKIVGGHREQPRRPWTRSSIPLGLSSPAVTGRVGMRASPRW